MELLYAGEQCSQCGLRFAVVPSKEYSDHLDWHFQLNRRDKDGLRKTSRNWFLHPDVCDTIISAHTLLRFLIIKMIFAKNISLVFLLDLPVRFLYVKFIFILLVMVIRTGTI